MLSSHGMSQYRWRKSSRSGNSGGDCVEIGYHPADTTTIAIRDSKNSAGPTLGFTATAWHGFRAAVEAH